MADLSDDFKYTVTEPTMALITFACTAFPVAWPVAEFVYGKQCDPVGIIRAGLSWLDVYDAVGSARRETNATTTGVPGDAWSGDDREAFGLHLSEFQLQLSADQAVAVSTGTTMVLVGTLLIIMMVACLVVAIRLAIYAAQYWLAVALSETGIEAAEAIAIEFAADDFANSAYNTLKSMDRVIDLTSQGGARVISGLLAANAAGQTITGNADGVFDNLVQTVVYGSLDTAAGLASKKEQDLTAESVGNGSTVGLAYADTTSAPKDGKETVDRAGEFAVGGDGWDLGGSAWLDRYRQLFQGQHH